MRTSRSLWYLSLIYGALHADVLLAADASPTDDTPVRELTVSEFLAEISSPRAESAPVTVPDEQPAASTPEVESSPATLDEYLEAVEQWGRLPQTEQVQTDTQADTTSDSGPWLDAPTQTETPAGSATGNVVEAAETSTQPSADAGPWLDDLVTADPVEAPASPVETAEATVQEPEQEVQEDVPEDIQEIVTTEVPASGQSGTADPVVTRTEILAALPEEEPLPADEAPVPPAVLSAADESVQVSPLVSSTLAERIAAMTDTPVYDGSDGRLLDLNTAVRNAVVSHPSVVESMGNFYSSLEEVDVARAGYFPRVSAGIGNGYRHEASTSWDNYNISASQTLYDFGRTSSSVEAASYRAERSRADILVTMDDLALDTAEAFIEVQRHQALLEVARAQTQAIAEIQSLAEARSQRGASTQSDVLQARSRHEAALAMEMQLQAQLDMWKRTLQNYIGQAVPQSVDSSFPGTLSQVCTAYPEDFSSVPKMLAAEAALEEAQARARQARANMFPTISLKANYGNVNNPSNIAFDQNFAERDFSVSLNLDSNLFEGGAARSRRQAAMYSLEAARAGKERALLEVSRSFREAHDQTRSYVDRMQYLDSRLQNIVSTQELYREQYLSLGTRSLLDLLNTEQEIYQSQFDREHTIHDLRQLQMVCLHSLGQLRNVFDINTGIAEGTTR